MATSRIVLGWPPVIERPKGKQAWLNYRKKMMGAGVKLKKKITALLLKEGFPENLQSAAASGDLKAVKHILNLLAVKIET